MSSILASLHDLFTSLVELIFSVFHSAFNTVSGLLTGVVEFLVGSVQMVLHTAAETLKAVGGLGNLIASNIVLIALVAGGIYGYSKYQGRRGRPVTVGNKKLN
ncbi:hypothetical protein N7541_005309 [Penicillium brevicompactum]|uniref:Uncharacterized protein n=1 Tax=Penicillium brevicompactum TaxID=5074 RepID=A0A9W9QGC6_PENBR|nr:uncharacterized protein N7506_005168 [Penicillium brevicompactum]KAJ5335478.1 hypothetical protein N7452_007881 [Penicillium brevicompactum]KAJ5337146.1 hypothetical protein N7506_005168 [Penicillium brevicompactum]KAJ5358151.1 hypothetical protein N7541_005309 [Penicillium brevicompactum]